VDRPKINLPNANCVLINTRATKKKLNSAKEKKNHKLSIILKKNLQNSNVCSYQHTTQFESKTKNTRALVDSHMYANCTETVKHNGPVFSVFFS
jgi:S-adenosylmethionine:tRNA-ribosyltransferase-isomerase (queuine synthetase)